MSKCRLLRCDSCKGVLLETEVEATPATERHNGLPCCPFCQNESDGWSPEDFEFTTLGMIEEET